MFERLKIIPFKPQWLINYLILFFNTVYFYFLGTVCSEVFLNAMLVIYLQYLITIPLKVAVNIKLAIFVCTSFCIILQHNTIFH
jgi:hypothetical protein